MKDERILAVDAQSRIIVVVADCTSAAADLSRAHLSGPVASAYLAQALAGVAVLGAETSRTDETVTFRMDCPGPLEGWLVECTEKGTLRGYTKKKILDDFDGLRFKDTDTLGSSGTVSVVRSVPGTVLATGSTYVEFAHRKGVSVAAEALEAYFAQSLQRRVRVAVCGAAGEDGVAAVSRAVMVECPPDGDMSVFGKVSASFDDGTAAKAISGAACAERTLLRKLGLALSEIRGRTGISFACRCSRERAQGMLDALPPADRAALPPTVDITCHLCGRTWTVANGNAST